jgi:hypothetical protein
MCIAAAEFAPGSLFAASLEVTGKTFIDGPCSISIDGDAKFNTSKSPGAAISTGAGTSSATFTGTGEITLNGDIGIEIVGGAETALVFQILPNFSSLDGQGSNTAILGNSSTTVRFENVQGTILGDIAAGLLIEDSSSNVTVYGQNLLEAPVEGNAQFTSEENAQPVELSDGTIAEELALETGIISGGEDTPKFPKILPFVCLQEMRNILMQLAPAQGNAVLVENFRTNPPARGGAFLAYYHALKNTPSYLAAVVGRSKSNGHIEQNCCGICWANASESFTWNMYGLWSENRRQTYGRERIACVGCLQECPLYHIHRKNYSLGPILGLGAEHRVMRQAFRGENLSEAVSKSFPETVINFSLALNMTNNSGKVNLAVRAGLWRPAHQNSQSPWKQLSPNKSHFYDMRCSRCFFHNLKGEMTFTKSSDESEFHWGLALICGF